MPPSGETISNLLGLLYDYSPGPEHWSEFLSALGAIVGAESCYFFLVDTYGRCSLNVNHGYDPRWTKAYLTHFHEHNEVMKRFIAAKRIHGEWIGTRYSVIKRSEYLGSYFFNEFVKPQGQLHMCAAALGGLDGELEGGIGMMRGRQQRAFGKESVALLAMLAPHLKRALNTHRALQVASHRIETLRRSVAALDVAVVGLDRCGRVIRMSPAAEAILGLRQGIELDGRFLRAGVANEQRKLAAIIAGAVATGASRGVEHAVRRSTEGAPEAGDSQVWTPASGGAMVISRWPPNQPIRVVVTPFHSSEVLLNDQPAALVFFYDPGARPGSRSAVLSALYGLTPAECRVTDLLIRGDELTAAADHMRMAVETARFHLKSIFRKTGVGRQAELVRLVLGLPSV